MRSSVEQRAQAVHFARALGVSWLDVLPLVMGGATCARDLDGWSAQDIRALRNVGVERFRRLVTAIRGAGIFLPDDGYPRDLPSALSKTPITQSERGTV